MTECPCPACNRVFRVPPDMVGKSVRCPKCAAVLRARAIGNRTRLVLAGVSADSPTVSLAAAANATAPEPSSPWQDLQCESSPRPRRRKARPRLLLLAVSFLVGLLVVVVVGGILLYRWSRPLMLPTRQEFERQVRACKSREEIIERFGKPTGTLRPDKWQGEEWKYWRPLAVDPASGKPDGHIVIRFDHDKPDRVAHVDFYP